VQNGKIKNDWQPQQKWAWKNKMADKTETKIETLYLNLNIDLMRKQNAKLSKNYQATYGELCQIKNTHKVREEKNIS